MKNRTKNGTNPIINDPTTTIVEIFPNIIRLTNKTIETTMVRTIAVVPPTTPTTVTTMIAKTAKIITRVVKTSEAIETVVKVTKIRVGTAIVKKSIWKKAQIFVGVCMKTKNHVSHGQQKQHKSGSTMSPMGQKQTASGNINMILSTVGVTFSLIHGWHFALW